MAFLKATPFLLIATSLGVFSLLSQDPFLSYEVANPPTHEASLSTSSATENPALTDAVANESESSLAESESPKSEVHTPEVLSEARYPTDPLFASVNTIARSSVVNILCQMRLSRSIRTVTGSGVIIDPRGVVLTNAHVGQFFLLTDYPKKDATECRIRTGNPATSSYNAELIYIPLGWVAEHAEQIDARNPTGTGEGDFALLYITDRRDTGQRPKGFVYLNPTLSENAIEENEQLLLVGYPAVISERDVIEEELFQVSALARVTKLFTFGGNILDLIGLSGNIASYSGSSGGAVANTKGELVGLIVTSTKSESFATRELRALTLSHINRTLREETGLSVPLLLTGDIEKRVAEFEMSYAPTLSRTLIDNL